MTELTAFRLLTNMTDALLFLRFTKNVDGDWSEVMAGTTPQAVSLGDLIVEYLVSNDLEFC
jgi:hypothetical protein